MEKTKYNDDWRIELSDRNPRMIERLAECRSTVNDVFYMAKMMHKYNINRTAVECLDRMIEWVCGWNSQSYILNDIYEKYDKKVKTI